LSEQLLCLDSTSDGSLQGLWLEGNSDSTSGGSLRVSSQVQKKAAVRRVV
jgi:hypothetical protein